MIKILLIVYDNGSWVGNFPLGTAYIARYLNQVEHYVEIYNQDVYHWDESHLTKYLDNNSFDFVGLGFIAGYYQYNKVKLISEAVNKSKNRSNFQYVLGGHGPSPDPEYFLKLLNADIVIRGQAEKAFCEIVNSYENDEDYFDIKGITYKKYDHYEKEYQYFHNEDRTEINDFDTAFPMWNIFPIEHYCLVREFGFKKTARVMPMISGTGCPFSCQFCYRLTKGFKARSTESIVEEIKILKRNYNITAIEFLDELLMTSKERINEICEAFLKEELNIEWTCSGRLNFADYESLSLMKKSGCIFINYGIESLDDQVLKNMNKCLTVSQIRKGIENTIQAKIVPGLNVIWGNIGDTKKSLYTGVNFIKKYNVDNIQLRTIRFVSPYPGSPLYYHAIEKGLLKDIADFYENKHKNSDLLTVNFTDMLDEEMYCELRHANQQLIDDYYSKSLKIATNQCNKLYLEKDASFRGFRQM